MKNIHKKRVILFIAVLITLTVTQHLFHNGYQNTGIAPFIIMWTPAITAIIVALATKFPFNSFGWKFSSKWAGVGWMTPVLYATIAYVLIWVFGLGDVPSPTFLERARLTLGMDTENDIVVILLSFFYITVLGLLPNMLLCLGEELGWRGFLVPELSKCIGLKNAGWISGIIWGIWHLPAIVSGEYGLNDIPLWYKIFCFTILVISSAIILSILRMISKSIWPAVIFHAVHNGIIQRFYDRLTIDNGMTNLFIGEFGIVLPIIISMFALYWLKHSKSKYPILYENPEKH